MKACRLWLMALGAFKKTTANQVLFEELCFCLSCVNLWFYREWNNLLILGWKLYYIRPTPQAMIGVILDVLLLGLLLFLALRAAFKVSRRVLYPLAINGVVLVTAGFFVNALRLTLSSWRANVGFVLSAFEWTELAWVLAAPVFLGLWVLIRFNRWVVAGARLIGILLFPLLLLNSYRVAKRVVLSNAHEAVAVSRLPSSISVDSKTRVLVFVFDAFDYELGFSKRPTTLELPELDLFAQGALSATNAYPPNSCTTLSVPSILSGTIVSGLKGTDERELYVYSSGSSKPVAWTSMPNLFRKVKARGMKTSAISSYHPLCMLFGESLDECMVAPIYSALQFGYTNSVWLSMMNHIRALRHVRVRGGAPYHLDSYKRVNAAARKTALDEKTNFSFIHYTLPHRPRIYDREKSELTVSRAPGLLEDYMDNLALVDRTFGELRRAMQHAGIWDRTHIILTTDHWWYYGFRYRQQENWRIPFVVKLAGETQPLSYDRPFNTVVTHELVLALLRDEIKSVGSLSDWLDRSGDYQAPVKCDDDALLRKKNRSVGEESPH